MVYGKPMPPQRPGVLPAQATPTPSGGVLGLSPDQLSALGSVSRGLLGMGTQMMQAGGYSDRPTSFMQALGQGGQGFMQGYDQGVALDRQRKQDAMAQQMQALQMEAARRQIAQQQAAKSSEARLKSQELYGGHPMGSQAAADYRANLDPATAAAFEADPAAAALYRFQQQNQVFAPQRSRLLSPEELQQQIAIAAASAGATAQARSDIVSAETKEAARAVLPDAVAEAEQTKRLVEDLLAHPGFSGSVGMPESSLSSVLFRISGRPLPGSPEAGFMARLEQLGGKSFLQAFESLKGGGQITQIEGEKATNAINRLQQRGQSEEEYRAAAQEFIGIVDRGIDRLYAAADLPRPSRNIGGTPNTSTAPMIDAGAMQPSADAPVIGTYNPATGKIE